MLFLGLAEARPSWKKDCFAAFALTKIVMFERQSDKLISPRRFFFRLVKCLLWALLAMVASLCLGICGYHYIENLRWVDALLNASMILSGMGPVDAMKTNTGKLFASFYALYSGLVLIGLVGLLLAPIFHRVLHSFHVETGKK